MNEKTKQTSAFNKILICTIVGLVLAFCIVLSMMHSDSGKQQKLPIIYHDSDIIIRGGREDNAVIPPFYTEDGHNALTITGISTLNAVPTPDREQLVVLDTEGILYVTDFRLSAKTHIAANANSILSVQNEGILYRDSKDRFYRYLFADGSVLSLGKCKDYLISKEGFTISFADKWGKVYVLTADSTEKKKIGRYQKSIDIVYVADDGNTVIYGSNVMKTESVMFYDNGTLTEVCDLPGMKSIYSAVRIQTYEEANGTTIAFIPCLVTDTKVYIKHTGEDMMTVDLNEYPSAKSAFTSEGLFVHGFFTDGLFIIDPNTGEHREILSAIEDYHINDDRIIYLTQNGDLYRAEILDGALNNQERIDTEVWSFQCTPTGQDVYYYKNADAEEKYYDLYVATVSETQITPAIVDSEVHFDYESALSFSTDEKTVYYFTKGEKYLRDTIETVQDTTDNYENYNILKRHTLGEETFLIDTNVIPDSLTSGREDGLIEDSSFIYKRRISGGDTYTWQFFDGTESCAITEQVSYNIADSYNVEENLFVPPWKY